MSQNATPLAAAANTRGKRDATVEKKDVANGHSKGITIRGDLLTLLILVLANLGASIWWASAISKDVEHLEQTDTEMRTNWGELEDTQVDILRELSALTQAIQDRGLTGGGSQ